ncbi:MAG: tRNA-dihydrouridine synthase family protein [Rhabdochlamydiaceae bacterium]|nr:tRNA-dihydrouridine synthase family protein [Rhabdochlamydiaceae bacterium]
MEGVGDASFRKAMASVGGMDEAVTEFISVPCNAHVQSLSKVYNAQELNPIPLAAQIMGSDPELMAAMAIELVKRGAPRIDINCGCPSNTVTGRGAGSSLLKDPRFIYEVAKTVVEAVPIPVTIKMRSGYEDTSLFQENVLAAEASGVRFITLHPRTKIEGYTPPARWDLIAQAKELVKIPIIGNGDIVKVQDALHVFSYTKCDALMIGRGAIINPFIFLQIKAHFAQKTHEISWEMIEKYLRYYFAALPEKMVEKTRVNKLKQLIGFLCKSHPSWTEQRQTLLSTQSREGSDYLNTIISVLQHNF